MSESTADLIATALVAYLRLRYGVHVVARPSRARRWHVRITVAADPPDGGHLRAEGALNTTGTARTIRFADLLARNLRRQIDEYQRDRSRAEARERARLERIRGMPGVHLTHGWEYRP